jgi:hypothetical protein
MRSMRPPVIRLATTAAIKPSGPSCIWQRGLCTVTGNGPVTVTGTADATATDGSIPAKSETNKHKRYTPTPSAFKSAPSKAAPSRASSHQNGAGRYSYGDYNPRNQFYNHRESRRASEMSAALAPTHAATNVKTSNLLMSQIMTSRLVMNSADILEALQKVM